MKELDLMIFDFDGTLVDSGADIAASVNHTLGCLSLPPRELPEIITFIGDGVQVLIERALGERNVTRYDEALALFASHYERHMLDTTRLYPGVEDALRHFQGKKKWIVTNKRYTFTKMMVDALGITPFFAGIIGADSTPYKKPDPRILAAALASLPAVDTGRVVVIGDGANDILLAKKTGAYSCAFLNGLGRREELLALGPDCTYERPEELMAFFS